MNYTKQNLKDLVYNVNGAAIEVHKSLGPGLLESVYHKCLIRELELRNIKFQSELSIPIQYKGIEVDAELRCDLLIEDKVIVELKATEFLMDIHTAQIMNYLKATPIEVGMLLNFGEEPEFKRVIYTNNRKTNIKNQQ